MRYGYFDNNRREYVIDRVDVPVPWTNYIGMKDFYGVFDHTAAGYVPYRSSEYHRISRFRPNGPMEGPGHYVYIRDEDTGDYWSISWQPVGKPKAHYSCRHGLSYSKYLCDYEGIDAEQTLFAAVDDPVEFIDVKLRNDSGRMRNLSVFSYLEFSFHQVPILIKGILPVQATVKAYPVSVEVEGKQVLAAYDISILLPDGTLWQPDSPLEVSIQLPGLEEIPEVAHIPEDGTPEIVPSRQEENALIFEASHFSVYAVLQEQSSSNPQCENEENCYLAHYLDEFDPPTILKPFGGAGEFNLFVVPGSRGQGDIHNWGEVHANAAIAGNITGTNQHIVYDANSVGNYSSDIVRTYDIGLLLGGMRSKDGTNPSTSQDEKVVVRNGSVLAQEQYDAGIDMDLGLDSDHIHYCAKKLYRDFEPDSAFGRKESHPEVFRRTRRYRPPKSRGSIWES